MADDIAADDFWGASSIEASLNYGSEAASVVIKEDKEKLTGKRKRNNKAESKTQTPPAPGNPNKKQKLNKKDEPKIKEKEETKEEVEAVSDTPAGKKKKNKKKQKKENTYQIDKEKVQQQIRNSTTAAQATYFWEKCCSTLKIAANTDSLNGFYLHLLNNT